MASNAINVFVCSSDHHHGIPTIDGVQPLLHFKIPGVRPLHLRSDRVEIRGCCRIDVNADFTSRSNCTVKQAFCSLHALLFNNLLAGNFPFMGLNGVFIRQRIVSAGTSHLVPSGTILEYACLEPLAIILLHDRPSTRHRR